MNQLERDSGAGTVQLPAWAILEKMETAATPVLRDRPRCPIPRSAIPIAWFSVSQLKLLSFLELHLVDSPVVRRSQKLCESCFVVEQSDTQARQQIAGE